jgi:hypothetical protein
MSAVGAVRCVGRSVPEDHRLRLLQVFVDSQPGSAGADKIAEGLGVGRLSGATWLHLRDIAGKILAACSLSNVN